MIKYPSLRGRGMIAIDCETRDDDLLTRGPGAHRGGFISGVAVATEDGLREYYPIAHKGGGNLPKAKVLSWLRRELAGDEPKVFANALYDLQFLSAAGVVVAGPLYDIQLAEPLIDETRGSYSLENLARSYLKEGKREDTMAQWIIDHLHVKPNMVKNNIWRAPAKVVAPYAVADVDLTLRIFQKQQPKLRHRKLWDLFLLECSLLPMLMAMRQRGVRVDLKQARELFKDMSNRQGMLENKILAASGIRIEPWNARNLARIFDKFGLEYPVTEITEAPSFTKVFLEHNEHPVGKTINEIRHLDKLRNTFVRGFILEGNNHGRIHCQFNQLRSDENGTVSGRFSSSQPNLQQIPTRSEDGVLIRKLFIPDRKKQLWAKFDWSQIEYRLMAHDAAMLKLPGAEEVVDAYQDDAADFHQIIADMTGLDRYSAKTVNFGLAYGEGLVKLCASLGLSTGDGKKLLNEYHNRAPFMKPLMNFWMEKANSEGKIRTLYGRYRHFNKWITYPAQGKPVLYSRHPNQAAERAFTYRALNARIQGSAADIMKLAMHKIWCSGVCDVLGAPHLTVHDELDWSFNNTPRHHKALQEIKSIMERCVNLRVPLKVDLKTGVNWGECK